MPSPNSLPDNDNQPETTPSMRHLVFGFAALAVILAAAALGSFEYAQHQRKALDELSATNQSLNASMTQLQEQLQSVTDRLTQRIEAESQAKPAPAPPPATRTAAPPTTPVVHAVRKPAVKSAPPEPVALKDPRVDVIQGQLADQQKSLASAREDLDKTRDELGKAREELNGKIDANRDELNGTIGRTRDDLNASIAHNHDELVALEKRSQRNYFEFAINKSKQFQKVGPLSLEVRKVDFKHKSYDVDMLVDDFTLRKQKVNLYEPVWITLNDAPEPVQLIVNQIDKDKISGYISAPKYRKSELDRTAAAPATTQALVQ